jgi:alpha-L-rhamnosidase
LWDSGKITSDQSVHLEYGGAKLNSAQRAFWRVKTWDKDGAESPWSEVATFEMGLLEPGDWHAKWIGSNLAGGMRTSVPAPMLRKTFDVQQPVSSARLYITALGFFDASINGQRVSNDLLAPGFTNFHKRIAYRTYDVTKLIRAGKNAIGTTLGDGWAIGFVGFTGRRQLYDVDRPLLFAQLQITTADGKAQTIATDESWKFAFGPIVSNDLLMGESYNANLEMPGWDGPDFDDSGWVPAIVKQPQVGALIASAAPPVRAMMEIKPREIKQTDNRRRIYLVDMGQNMVGHLRLRIRKPPANRVITIHGAEMLKPDNTPWFEGLRKAQATDTYQTKGGGADEIFEPRFTFHGFRYVQIEGYPGQLENDDVVGVVVHSDTPAIGTFTCSDDLINQLQQNIVWGQRGNFIDIPTDCPQRDERMGWMGDAQVFARTACFNMNVASFFAKWLDDVDDAQRPDGAFPSYAPNFGPNDGGPAWADAGVIVPWTVYQCFGDKRILERHYPAMQKYIAFLEQQHPNGIGDNRGYGDWLAMDNKTPKPLIGTAFFAHSADLMSRIAAVLEKKDDAAKYRATFERVRDAFNKEFVKPDGSIAGDTQTVYVLALQFDLLPENLRAQARQRLIDDVKKRQNHLSTGFVGTPYLSHVLPVDVAYDLLMQKTFPSWLYPVTKGATTVWERWDGWTDDKGFQDAGMNSFNHYAYGAVGSWMYQTVAGIDIEEPGYKKIRIHPRPGGGLTSASAKLETMYGTVQSAWKRSGDVIAYDITIPPNTTATIDLPGQTPASAGAGIYHFEIATQKTGEN